MNRLETVQAKYPKLDWSIWKTFDPSNNGKYLEWLGKNSSGEGLKLKEILIKFEKKKSLLSEKDINKYSVSTLESTLNKLEPSRKEEKVAGVLEVKDQRIPEGFKIYMVESFRAAKQYFAGTKWCISDKDTFFQYCEEGNIYLILKNGQKMAGVANDWYNHYDSTRKMKFSIYDKIDNDINLKYFATITEFLGFKFPVDKICKDHCKKNKNFWFSFKGESRENTIKITEEYIDKVLSLEGAKETFDFMSFKTSNDFINFLFKNKDKLKYKKLIDIASNDSKLLIRLPEGEFSKMTSYKKAWKTLLKKEKNI